MVPTMHYFRPHAVTTAASGTSDLTMGSKYKEKNEFSYDKLVKFVVDQPIDAVTREDANRLLTILKEMPSKNGGTLSASGIYKKMGMMSSLYIYANDHELTTKNLFKKLQLTVDTLPEDAQDATIK